MKFCGANNDIPVWGNPIQNAVDQMEEAMKSGASFAALMADHHLGYSVPVGGVIGYKGKTSPSAVGFDIGCGNKAIKLDVRWKEIEPRVGEIIDKIGTNISFGIGRTNNEKIDHEVFDHGAWEIPAVKPLKSRARDQLGTVGSGNHYVDVFKDDEDFVWVGVHFGSRGLGHTIASYYIREGGGKDGIHVAPVVLDLDSDLGEQYNQAMILAGDYATAGRDWVCEKMRTIIGGSVLQEVHNHHNFAWHETRDGEDVVTIRKGATPLWPDQYGFVGGNMCGKSVIIRGIDRDDEQTGLERYQSQGSTIHGAGRILSRSEAKGKYKNGKVIREPKVTYDAWRQATQNAGICLLGGDVDESPFCYKDLEAVLESHSNTAEVMTWLTPVIVAMAGPGCVDPYKD